MHLFVPRIFHSLRPAQLIEILSKSQNDLVQYPKCSSCSFFNVVKCVTKQHYLTLDSSHIFQIEEIILVWYRPEQMSHHHDFNNFFSENKNCSALNRNLQNDITFTVNLKIIPYNFCLHYCAALHSLN